MGVSKEFIVAGSPRSFKRSPPHTICRLSTLIPIMTNFILIIQRSIYFQLCDVLVSCCAVAEGQTKNKRYPKQMIDNLHIVTASIKRQIF